jgi:DNA polymerase III subunit beta
MRLQCAQEALAEALATVGRVVPNKSTLPILTNVLLEADAGDGLRVTATNLELTVSRRVRATVTAEGHTTAPARLLAEYVALLDRGKQVSLKLNPTGHKLHLACDRHEANVATLPAEDFPPTPPVDGAVRLEIDGAVLKSAIEQVVFAAAPDDTRPVLAGVLIRLETGTLALAAADGFRLALRTVTLPDTTTRAAWIVPARTLVEVAHCLPSAPGLPVTLSGTASDHQLHFALGEAEVTSRLIEGQFPDYERIIPRSATTSVILATADLLRATRVATVFARDNSNIVRLEFTPPPDDGTPTLGQVLVKATSAEMGDNVGNLEASVRGEAGQIAFNGSYLRDALESLKSPQVGLQLTGSYSPGVIRPVGDLEDAQLDIVMPMNYKQS